MKIRNFPLLVIMLLLGSALRAQSADALLGRLLQEDKASIDALVLYPTETRNDILQASQYPELIVRISEMQKVTSQQFQDLLSPYPQTDQEQFWDIARYPALVRSLASRGSVDDEELKAYPEQVQASARWADQGHRQVLLQMNSLYEASQNAFETLLKGYPVAAQSAVRNLVNLPEVLNILSDDLKMTVLVGDLYRRDPQWVSHKLDSLNLEVARKNAEDLQAWRDSLSANPRALQEFEAATEEYRKSTGAPVATEQQVTQYTTNNYYNYGNNGGYNNGYYNGYYSYYQPYPWWYGYPTWYGYPYWYPQPYWSQCGYYYGGGGVMIVYAMPSPYYTHWYFHQPWHHAHYPYLTHHMLSYHEGHRDSPSGFNNEVGNWVNENQHTFGKDWLKNNAGRPKRIEEFGNFEVAYHNEVALHPTKAPTEAAYFQAHVKEFPALNASVQASPKPAVSTQPTDSRPTTLWPTKPNTDVRPVTQPKGNTDVRPVTQPKGNTDVRPVTQPKGNTDVRPVEQPKGNTDVRPVTPPKNNADVPVYETRPANQPKNNTDSRPNNPPKSVTQPQYESRPQPPKIERPPQNQIQNATPAPSYHQNTWQNVEPRPTVSPKQNTSPRPMMSPSPSNSPKQGIKGGR